MRYAVTAQWDDIGIPQNSTVVARDLWAVVLSYELFSLNINDLLVSLYIKLLIYVCFLDAAQDIATISRKSDVYCGFSFMQDVRVEAYFLRDHMKAQSLLRKI